MYLVESYIKNGAGFMEHHGLDYEEAKAMFESAWEKLSDEERSDIDRIIFGEFEDSAELDDIFDDFEGTSKPMKLLAKRTADGVIWY